MPEAFNRRNTPVSNRRCRRTISLRSPPRIHRLSIHLRQSRRHHFWPRQSSERLRPRSHPAGNTKAAQARPAQSRSLRRKNPGHERPRPKNHRRHRPLVRRSPRALRRRTRRAPRLSPRHRRVDRRNVSHLPPRPPRRSPRPRPRRQKRLGHHLRQEAHAQAQGTPGFRRTLAPPPHRRKLVHVAGLPARRQRRHAQNPPCQTPYAQAPASQAQTPHPQARVEAGFSPALCLPILFRHLLQPKPVATIFSLDCHYRPSKCGLDIYLSWSARAPAPAFSFVAYPFVSEVGHPPRNANQQCLRFGTIRVRRNFCRCNSLEKPWVANRGVLKSKELTSSALP